MSRKRYGVEATEIQLIPLPEFSTPRTLPLYPTCAPPGSEAKIQVMAERLFNNEELYHPLDAQTCEKAETNYDGVYRQVRGNSVSWVSASTVGGKPVWKRFKENERDLAVSYLRDLRLAHMKELSKDIWKGEE